MVTVNRYFTRAFLAGGDSAPVVGEPRPETGAGVVIYLAAVLEVRRRRAAGQDPR